MFYFSRLDIFPPSGGPALSVLLVEQWKSMLSFTVSTSIGKGVVVVAISVQAKSETTTCNGV